MMPDAFDVAIYWFALPVAILLTIHGLDDLFIDLSYYLRGLWRRGHERLTVAELRRKPPQRIVMMVPAWQESPVIGRMLQNALTTLDYPADRFDIFVGTYPNDPETRREVAAVAARAPNVHEVVVPHDGPTSKADCLNWVYQGIRLEEERRKERFDILLMHDAEDVIHPLALRHYNYRIPDYDFVQTPVLPLEVPLRSVVGGTYMDEFTEHHLKDMIVRGHIEGLVPSAGVGSAFARDAFEQIALDHENLAFDVESLTEDYEIGLKLRLAGRRTFFAADIVEWEEGDPRAKGRAEGKGTRTKTEFIATREFFPTKLKASIRQRSRWVLGIGFQTWEKVGWKGPLPVLYTLYRDRRALASHLVALGAYVVVAYCLSRLALDMVGGPNWSFDRIIEPWSVLFWLVAINTVLLTWRLVIKIATLKRVYGWRQSLMSILRFPVANFVSFLATASAAKQFIGHKITGQPLRWKKTSHEFPDLEPLRTFHQRLGEILRTREGLTEEQLGEGLALCSQSGHPLGVVLQHIGAASAAQVDRALAQQAALPPVDPEAIPASEELLVAVPQSEADAFGVLPIREEIDGAALVACAERPDGDVEAVLAARLQRPVRFAYCSAERLSQARFRAYRGLTRPSDVQTQGRLGQRLTFAELLRDEELERALGEQRQTGEHLAEVVLRLGLVSPADLASVAYGPLERGFSEVQPEDVDLFALRRIGYAACAFHDLVPLWGEGEGRTVACSHPLHEETRRRLEDRLGTEVEWLLAPRAGLRAARLAAARRAWPKGISARRVSTEACELEAIGRSVDLSETVLTCLGDEGLLTGRSPLELAVARDLITPQQATTMLSRVYAVDPASLMPPCAVEGALPPEIEPEREASVTASDARSLEIVLHAPRPELARRIRALHPDRAIRWLVTPQMPDNPSERSVSA